MKEFPTPEAARSACTYRLHFGKMSYHLADELLERGVAVTSHDEFGWILMEPRVARVLMFYLAQRLGSHPDLNMMPMTGRNDHLKLAAHGLSSSQKAGVTTAARLLVLKDLLPAPTGVIDPYELADFKDANREQFHRFRAYIEMRLRGIATIESDEERDDAIEQFRRDTMDEVSDLKSKLTVHWRVTGSTALSALIAFGASIATWQSGAPPALGVAAAVASASSALIAPAVSMVDRMRAQGHPLAYAAVAQRVIRR